MGFECSGEPSLCSFVAIATINIASQNMESEAVACNTITFGIHIAPASDVFAQVGVSWDNFLSSPNASVLVANTSLTTYNLGILSVSYFLLSDLQNQLLIF